MNALAAQDHAAMADWLGAQGLPKSHGPRILRQFYKSSGTLETLIPVVGDRLNALVRSSFIVRQTHVKNTHTSADGTTKLLVGLHDGKAVECVLMPSHRPDRAAGCVSSRVGCAMGCDFCASTRAGVVRNLSVEEIVEQFLHLKAQSESLGRRLQTLVFMGMGEPTLNLDNVIAAIRLIGHQDLGGLGWRHITVSTVGIVPGMNRLTDLDLNIHLALSLHAPDDATRSKLVPPNKRWSVQDVLDAARAYHAKTGRIVTIEYCMLDGLNDSDDQAHLLANLIEHDRFHVNLIPYNAIGEGVTGIIYRRPSMERMNSFLNILRSEGVVAHFRQTRGDDVSAACGQLAGTTK